MKSEIFSVDIGNQKIPIVVTENERGVFMSVNGVDVLSLQRNHPNNQLYIHANRLDTEAEALRRTGLTLYRLPAKGAYSVFPYRAKYEISDTEILDFSDNDLEGVGEKK